MAVGRRRSGFRWPGGAVLRVNTLLRSRVRLLAALAVCFSKHWRDGVDHGRGWHLLLGGDLRSSLVYTTGSGLCLSIIASSVALGLTLRRGRTLVSPSYAAVMALRLDAHGQLPLLRGEVQAAIVDGQLP
jgi:hypothetical protein